MPSAQEIAAAVTREATKSGGTMTKWVDERVTSIVRSMLSPTAEAVRDIQERVQRLEAQQRLDAEESGGQ